MVIVFVSDDGLEKFLSFAKQRSAKASRLAGTNLLQSLRQINAFRGYQSGTGGIRQHGSNNQLVGCP